MINAAAALMIIYNNITYNHYLIINDYQVSEDEFGGMINAAAALPKKFGFDWWQVGCTYHRLCCLESWITSFRTYFQNYHFLFFVKASLNLITIQGSPSDQFKAIDENGDGAVSFDEWLSFAYKNYQVGDPDKDNG